MKRYRWVIASILWVSFAQVMLRLAMSSSDTFFSLTWLINNSAGRNYLLLGLFSYILSLLSWTQALRQFSLSHIYPLLSISYILVWFCSLYLPSDQGSFSWQALLGLAFIVSGVSLIVTVKNK